MNFINSNKIHTFDRHIKQRSIKDHEKQLGFDISFKEYNMGKTNEVWTILNT